jgi:hypothetical protein
MSYEVLNITSWLKFKESDSLDFLAHVALLKKDGIGLGVADLYKLAQQYGFDTQAKSTIEMCWKAYEMQFDE